MNKRLVELATYGAKLRLQTIQTELDAMYEAVPALFPNGRVMLTQASNAQPDAIRSKAAQAKKMIAQAEHMHKMRQAKKKKAAKHRRAVDSTLELISVQEAADILGLSQAGVRNYLNNGKLTIADRGGKHGPSQRGRYIRLRQADVLAIKHQRENKGQAQDLAQEAVSTFMDEAIPV